MGTIPIRRATHTKYAYDKLNSPGDYFLVSKSVKTFAQMKANVSAMNSYYFVSRVYRCENFNDQYTQVILWSKAYCDDQIMLTEKARIEAPEPKS